MLNRLRSPRAREDARRRDQRAPLVIRRATVLAAAFVVLRFATPGTVFAADVTWTNASGGSWNTPGNWSTNAVPGSSDRALITLAGTYTVTLDVSPSVAAIVVGAGSGQQTLFGSGRTVTVTDSLAIAASGVLDLALSTVNGPLIDRALVVTRRLCTFNGSSTVGSGATLRVLGASGGSATLTVGSLTNRGTIELTTIDGNFQSRLTGLGTVTNAAAGVIHVLPGTGGERHLSVPIINQGTVTLDYPLYLDNSGMSQLNDVGGTVDASNADLILSQASAGSFNNQGTVTIGATRTFSVSSGTFTNSGTIGGAGNLALSSVTIAGSLALPSTVSLDLTSCTVNAAVTNQGLLVLRGFSTFNSGLTNQSGATLRNLGGSGTTTTTLASAVTNHGTIELTTTAGVHSNLAGSGPLTNEAGGLIRALVGNGGERHISVPTTNRGTVLVESTVLYLDNTGSQLNDVGGTYDVGEGANLVVTQSASASFTNHGTVSVASGRTFTIGGGTFTNTGALSGIGNMSLGSVTAHLNTLITLGFTLVSVSGTLNVPQGLIIGTGTTLFATNVTVNGALTNHGVLEARRTTTLNGSLTIETGATLRVLGASGGSANLSIGPVTNRGAIELTTADGNFQSTLLGNGPLTNEPGSTFRVLPGTGGERHLQVAMVNHGTMTVEYHLYIDNGTKSQLNETDGTISLTTADVVLTQSGAGSFTNRGTLSVGAGRTFSISGGTFLNDVAGTLRGSGTIASSGPDITNAGTISPGASPGKLSFTGKVVQSATGRVRVELSGTQQITQYDLLSCSGQVVLGGTLEVVLLGGFVPPAGQPFVVLKYGTRTGTFSSYQGLDIGGTLHLSPSFTDTAMILSTGPVAITSVTPNRGGTGPASCVVHGAGFFPGLTARLVRGASQITGTLRGISPLGTAFGVTFDLTGAALGAWDVVVQGADGATVTLPNGFTVEALRPAWVSVQIVGRPRFRVGRPVSFTMVYTNNGNVDAVGVPVWVGGMPAGSPWSMSPPYIPPPAVPGASPVDYSNLPNAYSSGGDSTTGILLPRVPPGLSQEVTVTVTPSSTSSFDVSSWSYPPIFDPGNNPQDLQCLVAAMNAGFECVNVFLELDCIQSLVSLYVDTKLSVAGTGLDIVYSPESDVKVGCSIIHTTVGVAAGVFETIADCLGVTVPILKIYDAVSCLWSIGEAVYECSKAFSRDGEAKQNVSAVVSMDPNEKVGPSGVGLARFVRNEDPIPYAIYFENLDTATAPAAEIVVADTLDTTKVDVSTVALGAIRFGSHVLTPPPGSSNFLATYDLRPATNLVVKADVRLDTGAGILTWRLSSIDPDTGNPPIDPDAGFLPPNTTPPQGEGRVQYTVMARSDVPTGGVIGNRASIVFDTNEAILTPVWTNTVDATAPASAVDVLPAVTNSASFPVTWAGSDAGSGVRDFTIYVSVDGGPDSVWLERVAQTSATFTGSPGHSYAFYSVARDSVFLTEATPGQPDAQTTISPSVSVGERAFTFALRGALPNPADSRVLVSFELPVTSSGALELFDLAGRRVVHRDIGGLVPGRHSVSLGEGGRILPGMYFVRLSQGPRTAVKKLVVSQ